MQDKGTDDDSNDDVNMDEDIVKKFKFHAHLFASASPVFQQNVLQYRPEPYTMVHVDCT